MTVKVIKQRNKMQKIVGESPVGDLQSGLDSHHPCCPGLAIRYTVRMFIQVHLSRFIAQVYVAMVK